MLLKKIIPDINNWLEPDMKTIRADKTSHEGLIVPEIIYKYGSVLSKMKDLPILFSYMIRCILEAKKTYRSLKKQPAIRKTIISDAELEQLRALATDLGIGNIGFADVDPSYIFAGKCVLFKHALVVTMEMEHDKISLAPSGITSKEIFRTYYGLAYAVNVIADFLKKNGFAAEAGTSLGGEVNYPLLAEKAGLGVIGKHGILITPDFGPSLRLAAVYTEIENLPSVEDKTHLWIRDFCNKCDKCVRECPSGAIYKDTVRLNDGSQKHIDYKKCALPFSNDHGCTVCIKECVFFSQDYHKIKSSFNK